eukprot:TRINITY_DN8106_c0_g1_i1.p1 TRINITY_DN8106_c0_g1~~TRINITY_DN8106_c0_g1_i1.p1  ORF type:complete len:152 (+),score=7.71 TRINITY_DN8106_c0_g1_i1:177-632(+)
MTSGSQYAGPYTDDDFEDAEVVPLPIVKKQIIRRITYLQAFIIVFIVLSDYLLWRDTFRRWMLPSIIALIYVHLGISFLVLLKHCIWLVSFLILLVVLFFCVNRAFGCFRFVLWDCCCTHDCRNPLYQTTPHVLCVDTCLLYTSPSPRDQA